MDIKANLVDVIHNRIFPAIVSVAGKKIVSIVEIHEKCENYILPPFIDSHIHIESSMSTPAEFARIAAIHGTVSIVADPHEIANVMGISGVNFFVENSKLVPFKFYFGVPSCVPATEFETSGARLDAREVEMLLEKPEFHFLSEMMNYPGVIYDIPEVTTKIEIAKQKNKVIDGHCPQLRGKELEKYINAGITTDHECTNLIEALEKINLGMKIQIRNGSSAKDFDKLFPLIDMFPDFVMFASDDLKPDNLLKGHINLLIKKAVSKGLNLMNVLKAASLNPQKHYKLDIGMLQVGDEADFVIVDNLNDFTVLKTYCAGEVIAENGISNISIVKPEIINNFNANLITTNSLEILVEENVSDVVVNVIGVNDGQILTSKLESKLKVKNGKLENDAENDILKLVILNRYAENQTPAVAFVKGFGLRNSAIATSIAHDSHNIIAVGDSDEKIVAAINEIIKYKGGISVATDENVDILKLPIAGIISDDIIPNVAAKHKQLENTVKNYKCNLTSPFMTLSFLALLVIPELKLSDKGLFNSQKFCFEELIIKPDNKI